LHLGWAHFDREVEKAVSVSAGIASATFSHACGATAHFDARVVVAAADEQVVDYFRWRQADATRCAWNAWCYWTLRKEGLDPRSATKQLSGLKVAAENELLFTWEGELQRHARVAAAGKWPVLGGVPADGPRPALR